MKLLRSRAWLFSISLTWAALGASSLSAQTTAPAPTAPAPVTLTDNGGTYVLSNGIVTATINKQNGRMPSLQFRGLELMGHDSGVPAGYWETNIGTGTAAITIDPAKNGGERAEVSVKGTVSGFNQEMRYTMGRGESGVYTYAIYTHTAGMGRATMPENRYGTKLNPAVFDWLSVDANRNLLMATSADWDAGIQMGQMKEARYLTTGIYKGQVEHKYDYCAYQFEVPAFGWSSTKEHIGFWFINPTIEFLGGGPTKDELDCHLDDNTGGDPLILDYWKGTHYGGADCTVAADEVWSKVVGPIYLYCNYMDKAGASQKNIATSLWQGALTQAARELDKWPYDWVQGVDYPHKEQRATVSGQLVLTDPQAATTKLPNLYVGLAYPDADAGSDNERAGRNAITWQNDAKHYEFWVRGDENGKFTIPKVRPGTYELHAYADGVLGEYSQQSITIKEGQTLDLGKINWTPLRYGKQLWDIGIPNRTAAEFLEGDNYWHWGWYVQYIKLFPNDVSYTIGKSDFHKDWFLEQVPHILQFDNANGDSDARDTPWAINFNLKDAPQGTAILRLAICGAGNSIGRRGLHISVNGQDIGAIYNLQYVNTISRDGIGGIWVDRDVSFDAKLMKQGENKIVLTVPAASGADKATDGVMYDYLRLELNDQAKFSAPVAAAN